ncbi:TolA-binding protein [Sphingomonas sp. PvP055]|uniref:hypothetical protein n=1 Tax=Sphingomonas sp. PvP055 TaxID=3156391 RepID=UPI00339648B9
MTRRRVLAAASVAAVALLAVRASGSGGPPPLPDYVTANALQPIDRVALAAGRVGIVKGGAPAPVLYLDWRLLNGLASGAEATDALATPCCGERQDNSYAWLAARRTVPGASPDVYYVATERQGPNYTSIPTCFGDAFDTAVVTLKDRVAHNGAGSPWVRAWLAAQDAVFDGCSKTGVVLPPLDAAAPAWLRADHAYQAAALALYDGRLAEAERSFAAIERDHQSSWQPLAVYLQVRTVLRAAITGSDAAGFARAHAALARLQQAPAGTYGKSEIDRIAQILEYHERPAALLARLDRDLGTVAPAPDIAVKFKDYWALSETSPVKPEAADWIATVQTRDRSAGVAHAQEQWQATHRTAWLVAALSLVTPQDGASKALVADAARTDPRDPAWLSLHYHAMRLTIGRVPDDVMRAQVDPVLARTDLTPSDRNIFLAIRTQLAPTLADFAVHALRQPYCAGSATGCIDGDWPAGDGLLGRRGQAFVGLGGDARVIIDRLPLASRLALGRDPDLPRDFRLDLALTNYARAVALRNTAAIDETARALIKLLPQVRADWARIVATAPGPNKRFAEIFVMAKIPSLRTDLADYTRPEGTEPAFSGYWTNWMTPPVGHQAAAAAFPPASGYMPERYRDGGNASEDADPSDLPCAGKCGQGRFPFHTPPFAVPLVPAALAERQRFPMSDGEDYAASGATSMWDEALAYVRAHPNDPRAAETLYRLIRVGRWGGNHNHLGKRAFALLHSRYPKSIWAKRSPYYYNG